MTPEQKFIRENGELVRDCLAHVRSYDQGDGATVSKAISHNLTVEEMEIVGQVIWGRWIASDTGELFESFLDGELGRLGWYENPEQRLKEMMRDASLPHIQVSADGRGIGTVLGGVPNQCESGSQVKQDKEERS